MNFYNIFYRTFWFISLYLSKNFCSILSLSWKVHWPKTCAILFLHSFLSLVKRFKGLIAWEFYWFFLFPLNKRFQRTNCLRYLLFPLTKIQGSNRLRILCLNTLEGTSFGVQVERTSTWVVILRTREGTSLVDKF